VIIGRDFMVDKIRINKLHREIAKQKEIFLKFAPKVINPDGSDEYKAAKKAFDAADRRIKEIEKELIQLQQGSTAPPSQKLSTPIPGPLDTPKTEPPSRRKKSKTPLSELEIEPSPQTAPSQAKVITLARGHSGDDDEEEEIA
jgi:hypothetical protein